MRKKLFQLNKVGRTMEEISTFGRQLIAALGDEIFSYQTKQELVFHVLKLIFPVCKRVKLDDNSIDSACDEVLKHFRSKGRATLRVSTGTGWKEIKPKKEDDTTEFCKYIIRIEKVPGQVYARLLSDVSKDLISITELIKWYENQPCIQKYLAKNEIPKPHDDRVIYDFYKRCISERIEILNYLLYSLKAGALEKANYSYGLFGIGYYDLLYDRPYRFARPFAMSYFDCREIDLARHRLGEFYFDEAIGMIKIYYKNKASFYRKYFKRIPVQQHFQNFNFYLPHLPLMNNRVPIFEELKRLFNGKRWISFYALALPQVEGLFSEMCLAVSPDEDLSQKSLTHKVNTLRPFNLSNASYFDYYQYHIPKLRNKFAHTGYDEDFKLKSFDILVDLSQLLKIFYELNNPVVKITRLHAQRNGNDFLSIREFVEYFKLLDVLKPGQRKQVSEEGKKFEAEFLSKDCGVEYICYSIMQDLPKKLSEFIASIKAQFSYNGFPLEFEKMNKPQISALLEDEKKREIMRDSFLSMSETVDSLDNYGVFISRQKKYLPTLKPEIGVELERLNDAHGKLLKQISEMRDVLMN